MNLDWMARKHGTDKSSSCHGYTEFYEQMFGAIRKRIHSVLELGVADGSSLRMWADWFPNATIYGVDQSLPACDMGAPISVYQIEQTNEGLLKETFDHKYLQIIIDDCSHDVEKTLESLRILFPLLEDGGWYVIEDMNPNGFMEHFCKWSQPNRCNYESVHIFMDKGGGSHIYFIHKV